jgi:hypothetical protein
VDVKHAISLKTPAGEFACNGMFSSITCENVFWLVARLDKHFAAQAALRGGLFVDD